MNLRDFFESFGRIVTFIIGICMVILCVGIAFIFGDVVSCFDVTKESVEFGMSITGLASFILGIIIITLSFQK